MSRRSLFFLFDYEVVESESGPILQTWTVGKWSSVPEFIEQSRSNYFVIDFLSYFERTTIGLVDDGYSIYVRCSQWHDWSADTTYRWLMCCWWFYAHQPINSHYPFKTYHLGVYYSGTSSNQIPNRKTLMNVFLMQSQMSGYVFGKSQRMRITLMIRLTIILVIVIAQHRKLNRTFSECRL